MQIYLLEGLYSLHSTCRKTNVQNGMDTVMHNMFWVNIKKQLPKTRTNKKTQMLN